MIQSLRHWRINTVKQYSPIFYVFFFWAIPRRRNFVCQPLGTHFSCINTSTILKPSYYSSYLPAYEDGTDSVFRKVGIQNSDAGELPRKKTYNIHNTTKI
jgi:hypothetical protein